MAHKTVSKPRDDNVSQVEFLVHEPTNGGTTEQERPLSGTSVRSYSTECQNNVLRKAIRCLVFPTGAGTPDAVWTISNSDIPRGNQIYERDLDLDGFFPHGCISFRLQTVPVNGFPLPNDFRIFISRKPTLAPINKSIQKQFGYDWRGNILIAKYGRSWKDGFIQVQIFEPSVVKILAGLWIEEYIRGNRLRISKDPSATAVHFLIHDGPHQNAAQPNRQDNETAEPATRNAVTATVKVPGKVIRCLRYPTAGVRSVPFDARLEHSSINVNNSPEFAILDHIFTNGACSFRVRYVPGTMYPLTNDLHVFITRDVAKQAESSCIRALFGQTWYGDIVVVKYGKSREEVCHIMNHEIDILNVYIGMWLEEFLRTGGVLQYEEKSTEFQNMH